MSDQNSSFLTIKDASEWATDYLRKSVYPSNISYLIQYGKIKKFEDNGSTLIKIQDLINYYQSYNGQREVNWKRKLGEDVNWTLSFDHLREKDTTKHVHRLHPYKGKFIPQLVEYFLDQHTDEFKKQVYFKPGDIILDPFAGSGTALVQANELKMHAIGIDVSRFNCMIAEVKMLDYDFDSLNSEIWKIRKALVNYEVDNNITEFERELVADLVIFNAKYFPSPEFKYKVSAKQIDEENYSLSKTEEFLKKYNFLVNKYHIDLRNGSENSFLEKWYITKVKKEIAFVFDLVKKVKDIRNKKLLAIILSRTIRSCRATTHSDLATLKSPQLTAYYCFKHKKMCKPLFSMKPWFDRYAIDTFQRVRLFGNLKSNSFWRIISGDSRKVNIDEEVKKKNHPFYEELKEKRIKGIFTSPPYVGQIDYHEQHAYAYDLFGFTRKDNLEIGPLYKGKGYEARLSYIQGIADVLNNCGKYLAEDYNVFLVANDKFNLYPTIAEKSGMKIVNQFKRPVLNRTERDRTAYSETIFHLKSK